MHRRTPLLTVLVCLVLSAPLRAQESIPAARLPFSKGVEVAKLIAAFEAKNLGDVGFALEDLTTGKTFYLNDATKPFTPASNQKLLTTAFALERLGADFRFTTAVVRLGDDLVLTGDADPTLGDPTLAEQNHTTIYAELDRWARETRQKVGPRVPGDIVLRVQVPAGAYFNPDWAKRHRGEAYAAPVAALNFHNNCYHVTFRAVPDPAAAGEAAPPDSQPASRPARIEPAVTPASRFIRVQDNTKPGTKHLWRLVEADDGSSIKVLGTVSAASSDPLPTPVGNPPMLLGRVFAERLIQAGVIYGGSIVSKPAEGLDLSEGEVLAGTRTPLVTALTLANRDSLNLAADCVFLRAGDGSWDGSSELMRKTLLDRYKLDADALTVRDGSGLAGGNRISPANLVKLLSSLAHGDNAKLVLETLARSGESGTLEGRLDDDATGRIAAKTGTLAGVKALSGYVLDVDGKPAIAFSILVNDVRDATQAKQLQNRICELLIEHVDR